MASKLILSLYIYLYYIIYIYIYLSLSYLVLSFFKTLHLFVDFGRLLERSEYRMNFEQEWLKELDKESIPHNEDLQAGNCVVLVQGCAV